MRQLPIRSTSAKNSIMNSPTIKQVVQELLNIRETVTVDEVIEYLDYMNKVRYSRTDIIKILEEIGNEKGKPS